MAGQRFGATERAIIREQTSSTLISTMKSFRESWPPGERPAFVKKYLAYASSVIRARRAKRRRR